MSLQKTVLPSFVLAGLFPSSLVSLPETVQEQPLQREEIPPVPISFMGKNTDNITIGVYFTGHPYLPPEPLGFLANVLKACQRNVEHVALINFAAYSPPLTDIIDQLNPRLIMLFGSHPPFQAMLLGQADFVTADVQQCKIIRIPGFDRFAEGSAESKQLKGKLWLELRQLFNL